MPRHSYSKGERMDEAEHKAKVFEFVKNLSARTGVDLDPEEVWEDLQQRMVKDADA